MVAGVILIMAIPIMVMDTDGDTHGTDGDTLDMDIRDGVILLADIQAMDTDGDITQHLMHITTAEEALTMAEIITVHTTAIELITIPEMTLAAETVYITEATFTTETAAVIEL